MSDFKPFLNYVYPLSVLQARAKILLSMVRYVTEAAADPYERKNHPFAGTFRDAVSAAVAYPFIDNVVAPKRFQVDAGSTAQLIAKSYTDVQKWRKFEAPFAVPLFTADDETIDTLQALFPDSKEISMADSAKPTVLGAYELASRNISQIEMQMLTLHVVCDLARHSEYTQGQQLAGSDELLRTLFERHSGFLRDYLMFGGLLGGSYATEAIKKVARYTCYDGDTNYAIVQFLTGGGRHPGIYKTQLDTDFKADIERHYNKL